MRRLLFTVGLLAAGIFGGVSAQDYVGLSTKEAQRRLQKQIRPRQQPNRAWQAAPTLQGTLAVYTRTLSLTADLRLSCDSLEICYAEQYFCKDEVTALDWQRKILLKKEYEWQALNENQHVSNMERQRLLEIYRGDTYWVVQVLRTDWSPLQYQLLFSNQPNPVK